MIRVFEKGRAKSITTRTDDKALAEARLRSWVQTAGADCRRNWADDQWPFIKNLYNQCKGRAKFRGMEFDLTFEEVVELFEESRGRCTLTGVPFSLSRIRGPWVPSIDRINSDLGYVRGNVRVVCFAANIAMQQWGENVLLTMMESMASCMQHRMFGISP